MLNTDRIVIYKRRCIEIKRLIYKYFSEQWPHYVSGLLFTAFSVILEFSLPIHLIAFIIGYLIGANIDNICWNWKIKSITRNDREVIKRASKKSKNIYIFEKNILEHYHEDMILKYSKLFGAGTDLNIYEYERLLKIFANIATKQKRINLEGTCLILPDKFNKQNDYAAAWRSIYNVYKNLQCTLRRILCDHEKATLIKAIENKQGSYEDFCEWNKETGFELYIYKANYDQIRIDNKLALNDFAVFNNLIVVGGDISKNDKIRPKETDKRIIKKSLINYNASDYTKMFNSIIEDKNRCMKIDLDSSSIYDDTMRFLKK